MMPVWNDRREAAGGSAAWAGWLRAGALIAALSACGGAQWHIARGQHWPEASAGLIVGAIACALLLGRPAARVEGGGAAPVPFRFDRRGIVLTVLGVAMFAYAVFQLSTDWVGTFDFAAPLLVLGVILWSTGLALCEPAHPARGDRRALLGWERWLFLAIVAMGFLLRFHRYTYFPPSDGFCVVEGPLTAQISYRMLRDHFRPWEFLDAQWLAAAGFTLFGYTVTALRIPFTIVSALTVLALYALLRQLVSRPAALFATALFAVCRWDLVTARCADNVYPTTLVVVVIYYLCVRAHKEGRLALYPWIGLLSAYTLYVYAGYRGTSLFVLLFFAGSLLIHWRAKRAAIAPRAYAAARQRFWRQILGLTLAAVAFAGALLPLAYRLRTNPAYFVEAAVRATNDSSYYSSDYRAFARQVGARTLLTVMMFNHQGPASGTLYWNNRPLLDPVSGLFFTVGLVYCIIWWRYRFHGFFVFTFFVLLFFGTVFVHNFDIRRLHGLIPLIFVLVAFVADRLCDVCAARFGTRVRPALIGLTLAAFAAALHDNYTMYFVGMMNDPAVRSSFQNIYTIGIRHLHKLPPNSYMLMFSTNLNFFLPSDFEWWRGDAVPGRVTADLMPILNGEQGPWTGRKLHLFIADPFEHDDIARLLRQRFPMVACARLTDADIPPYLHFSMCSVPPAPAWLQVQQGVRASYFRGDSTEPLLQRFEPVIGFAFLPDVCHFPAAHERPPCRAEWDGTWEVEQSGRYDLSVITRNAKATMTVDDQPVGGPIELTAGPHRIHGQARFESVEDAGVALRQRTGNGQWRLLQFASPGPDGALNSDGQ
jgi:hypothetical protein